MEDFIVKVILVGATGVGKTSFVTKYCDGYITDHAHVPTIGVDFKVTRENVKGKIIKCHIWDTAGQENFVSIITSYFKSVGAVIAMFDVTRPKTLNDAVMWIDRVKENTSSENLPIILVANKIDREHQCKIVSEAKTMANKNSWLYTEISAITGLNINNVMTELIDYVYTEIIEKDIPTVGVRRAGHTREKTKLLGKKGQDDGIFTCCKVS